jgi:hypothetical protein
MGRVLRCGTWSGGSVKSQLRLYSCALHRNIVFDTTGVALFCLDYGIYTVDTGGLNNTSKDRHCLKLDVRRCSCVRLHCSCV